MAYDPGMMFSPGALVEYWFKSNSITVRQAQKDAICFSKFIVFYAELPKWGANKSKFPIFNESTLQHAFEIYIHEHIAEERKRILGAFTCEIEATGPVDEWVAAVTGKKDELDCSIMKHWMWQVKRKAFDLPVKYHIMPVLFGKQQGGKTEALKALIKPLAEFRVNIKMNKVADDRVYETMSQNLIILLDELQGIEKTDLNALKNQITTDSNTYRKLYTHSDVTVPQRCSFIGASNKHINEMLADSTGMRRFYELIALDTLKWDVVNTLDYQAMWVGIDESRVDGYLNLDMLKELSKVQSELVTEEPCDTFIREKRLRLKEGQSETRNISSTRLYKEYQIWETENGLRWPISKTTFINRLKNRSVPWYKNNEGISFTINALSEVIGEGPIEKVLRVPIQNQ